MNTPVLFLMFNRPDLASQVFARIRQARPVTLFVAADGPRPDRSGEAELCAESRRIIEQVDWPCEVITLFRDENLGCRMAVSEAISWFFEHVEEGIILEDDCVPDLSFFQYCSELLKRYRVDDRIMAISGNNHQQGFVRTTASYYFSKYPHCWGWATWRRSWIKMDISMQIWPGVSETRAFRQWFSSNREKQFWIRSFDDVAAGRVDTWDVAWVMACWYNKGLTILPTVNLVDNVGWGNQATHTKGDRMPYVSEAYALDFPLVHPRSVSVDHKADTRTDYLVFSGPPESLFNVAIKYRWRLSFLTRNAIALFLHRIRRRSDGDCVRCLLCGSNTAKECYSFAGGALVAEWQSSFGIDISGQLSSASRVVAWHCPECKLKFFDPKLAGDSELYRQLQKLEYYYMSEKWEYLKSLKFVNSIGSVVEVGCGAGAFLDLLFKQKCVDGLGLEMNPDAANVAVIKGRRVIQSDLARFAVKYAAEFDVVCHFQVLEHVPDPYAFLENCVKLLKQDGLMIVAVPNGNSFLRYCPDSLLNMPPHHISVFSSKTMVMIARLFNLKLVKCYKEPLADYHLRWYCDIQIDRIPKVRYLTWPLISFLRKALPWLITLLRLRYFITGHSVLAIYRKCNPDLGKLS